MINIKKYLTVFAIPIFSIFLAFLMGAVIMILIGANPLIAFSALFKGAFGTTAGVGTTLNKATPLIFTTLCACFAYKCGVYNLGGEGQFLIGATSAFCTVSDFFSWYFWYIFSYINRCFGRRDLGADSRYLKDWERPE